MPKRRLAIPVLLAAFIGLTGYFGPARAAETAEVIKGVELRQILSGNTVWVFRQDWTIGDEFHHPDGRVFGFNGFETVVNGCWDVVGNEVCYYYKDDYLKGRAHCWTFKRVGTTNFSLRATANGFTGFGRLDPGNPRHLNDNGKPWICQRLYSQHDTAPASAALPPS